MPVRKRAVHILLFILGLFLIGTVVVLSSVSYYLAIPEAAYITEHDLQVSQNTSELVPRIIHQTWKTEILPEKWSNVSDGCRAMMPDYEYMLWTDASSREFIADNYPWFLDTFDSYRYPIQRADAIRYFVLHHYGGVYLDLDIGCLRRVDPLLTFPIVLPRTVPVGVSNDLMVAEKGHPFMVQTIHNLVTFDHSWVLNYPTVMFSTGPMFLSAQYSIYSSSHPSNKDYPRGEIRILPTSLYGKNAEEGAVPNSFFSHYYGSSWHADDAAFIGFLGQWGFALMWIGLVVLIVSLLRLGYTSSKQRNLRSIGGYEVLLPRWVERRGRWYLDMGWLSLPGRMTPGASPVTDRLSHGLDGEEPSSGDEDVVPLIPLPLGVRPSTPSSSSEFSSEDTHPTLHFAVGAARRIGNRVASLFRPSGSPVPTSSSNRRPRRRVLFFLPAFMSGGDISLPGEDSAPRFSSRSSPARHLPYPLDKGSSRLDVEEGSELEGPSTPRSPLPPYSEAPMSPFRVPAPESSGTRRPYTLDSPRPF